MVERKPVLITGASSGIGEVTAHELVARGFHVFAGVRNAADGERLRATLGERCTPVTLDVADSISIAAACAVVRAAGGLYGVVNNAGIAVTGPLEYLSLADLRRQFEVNVYGPIAVTQAMLPLLRRSLGRVVNVGSISGRAALPILGPYGASKAALDALTQSLRMELAPFDIDVCYVEPGAHRTPIWERSRRSAARVVAELPPIARDYYGRTIEAMTELMTSAEQSGDDPARVARVIARALEARRPRPRYTVGSDTRTSFMLGLIPQTIKERLIARRIKAAAHA